MRDLPYRWIEAIQDRRDYIEDQLRLGSPVVGLPYAQGSLLLTVTKGAQKIFEVHDRIALSAIGHPADIERLRMLVTDTASVQAFQSATEDVNLHRLTHYVLAHTFKQAFEAIVGEAYIIKMLLVEIGNGDATTQFTQINYDGNVKVQHDSAVIGGTMEIENAMQDYLAAAQSDTERDLTDALQLALKTWAVGRGLSQRSEDAEDNTEVTDEQIDEIIKTELENGEIEAGILDASISGDIKFRILTQDEIQGSRDAAD
jgi:proteasome alpha subunit